MPDGLDEAERIRSFDDLAREHRRLIWSVAYRYLRNPDDALDVTQEVLLRLHGWLPRLRSRGGLKAWLYRTTTNAALNFRRAEANRARLYREAGAEREGVAGSRESRGFTAALAAAVAKLPRQQRAVVTLRLLEEQTFVEIAEAFGVAEGTVRVQFARALRRLRRELSEWNEPRLRPAGRSAREEPDEGM